MAIKKEAFLKIIVIQIGTVYFGIELEKIKVILKNTDMTMIPVMHSPDITGILNHDGDMIPIVNLYKKMQLKALDLTNISYFMVVSFNQKMIALPVDKIDKYYNVAYTHLNVVPPLLQNPTTRYFHQIIDLDGRLVLMIDLVQLFDELGNE